MFSYLLTCHVSRASVFVALSLNNFRVETAKSLPFLSEFEHDENFSECTIDQPFGWSLPWGTCHSLDF